MRNSLPRNGQKLNESAIINLDDAGGLGTHWVSYKKRGAVIKYFDRFGDLKPPKELIDYFHSWDIKYNYERFQNFNTYNSGHLCLAFLSGKLSYK